MNSTRKVSAMVGSAIFLIAAPGVVVGLVPWWISHWRFERPFFGFAPLRIVGALLIAVGVLVLLDSFRRFALQGVGTPAPVFPTRTLVVTGLYRYVRNPMYVAVVGSIVGQALLLGNRTILIYAFIVWTAFHLFVLAYEEPTLRSTFGDQYREFCEHVPRWIPRLRPWTAR